MSKAKFPKRPKSPPLSTDIPRTSGDDVYTVPRYNRWGSDIDPEYIDAIDALKPLSKIKRRVKISKPPKRGANIAQLKIEVPKSWPYIVLAPFYDVHIGNETWDEEFTRAAIEWVKNEKYTLSWFGGDILEMSSRHSVGDGVYAQVLTPQEQFEYAIELFAPIREKLLFSIPGNHEDRTSKEIGINISKVLADVMRLPYSNDYMYMVIEWANQRIRVATHHGSGGARTPGSQRNAARKMMNFFPRCDFYWTGHLHSPLWDLAYQLDTDVDGFITERPGLVMLSSAHLKAGGGYAAKSQMVPSSPGMSYATIYPNGELETVIRTRGIRT